MENITTSRPMPAIIVSDIDQERLSGLALAAMDRAPDVASVLMAEMDRATVLDAASVPANVVRMGSTVRYRSDDGKERRVTLVFPVDADIAAGRISVLTPIGAALIGVSEGQSIDWITRDGREQRLTVLDVAH
ncbi:MAG: nucleoside diphosphate kinase regulator [Bauldia sp.]|nr:nucleoside diphosphate kinase regulator [Bauldia sp.]